MSPARICEPDSKLRWRSGPPCRRIQSVQVSASTSSILHIMTTKRKCTPRRIELVSQRLGDFVARLSGFSVSRVAYAREPAVAPDRGGITVFRGSVSHQPPRQGCYAQNNASLCVQSFRNGRILLFCTF